MIRKEPFVLGGYDQGCDALAAPLAPDYLGMRYVPVSFVATDWNVTPRRIRALLAVRRLAGRLLANGYWEVLHPYVLTLGTRGPALKCTQKSERKSV
jgi:hypothetical protein